MNLEKEFDKISDSNLSSIMKNFSWNEMAEANGENII